MDHPRYETRSGRSRKNIFRRYKLTIHFYETILDNKIYNQRQLTLNQTDPKNIRGNRKELNQSKREFGELGHLEND